ncbi:MAG: M12 family metallo-peptidase [Acidimicrobiia bacterium]
MLAPQEGRKGTYLAEFRDIGRAIALSVLALGTIWLVAAVGISRGFDALGLWETDAIHTLECGRQLAPTPEGVPVQTSLRAAVFTDDAWQELDTNGTRVRSLVVQAAGLLRGTGVSITPVSVKTWNPPPEAESPQEILDSAKAMLPIGDADIAIVLTARSTTNNDGAADVGGRYAVVRHHPGESDKDIVVLAHELGHLFGAHHGCDVIDTGGMMGATGFENAELLCPCTRRIIERNVSLLHLGQVPSP